MKSNCILFYLKYPEEGKVKTRLAESLDSKFVVELYKNFILDLLNALDEIDADIRLCFTPKEAEEELKKMFSEKYIYSSQIGKDLGQRLKNSFTEAFHDGYKKVVVIGSDSPDLPIEFIKNAFSSLDKNDAVIGPATDGGYYLIGFRNDEYLPSTFDEIEWSSKSVFVKTMKNLGKGGKITFILPAWSDVDRINDLKDLIERNQRTTFLHSKTIQYLLKNKELLKISQ